MNSFTILGDTLPCDGVVEHADPSLFPRLCPVTVGVLAIGGPAGETHGQKGQPGGHQVQAGMRRLRQDTQAAGPQAHHNLERGQPNGGQKRAQRGRLFLAQGIRHPFQRNTGGAAARRRGWRGWRAGLAGRRG